MQIEKLKKTATNHITIKTEPNEKNNFIYAHIT